MLRPHPASILANFSFFRRAGAAAQSAMVAEVQCVALEPGKYFYREGDRCSHFGLVGSGNIRVFKRDDSGHQISLYHVLGGHPCLMSA